MKHRPLITRRQTVVIGLVWLAAILFGLFWPYAWTPAHGASAPVHRVALAAPVVTPGRCNATHSAYLKPHTPHVSYRITYRNNDDNPAVDRYRVFAHTESAAYRWRKDVPAGPGWTRVTRRLAYFDFDLPDFTPGC